MIITNNFVMLNFPKIGATYVRHPLERMFKKAKYS